MAVEYPPLHPRRHQRPDSSSDFPSASSGYASFDSSSSYYPAPSSSGYPDVSSSSLYPTSSSSPNWKEHHSFSTSAHNGTRATDVALSTGTTIHLSPSHTQSSPPAGLDHMTQKTDLATAALAVVIVIPLLIMTGIAGLVFWLLTRRERRKRAAEREKPAESSSDRQDGSSMTVSSGQDARTASTVTLVSDTPPAAGLRREKSSSSAHSRQSRTTRPPSAFVPPTTQQSSLLVPANQPPPGQPQNPSYYTGLDTWSLSSRSPSVRSPSGEYAYAPNRMSMGGTTFADPPPPYSVPNSSDPAPPSLHSHDEVDEGTDDPFADSAAVVVADGFYGSALHPRRSLRGVSARPQSECLSEGSGTSRSAAPTITSRADTPRPFSADTLVLPEDGIEAQWRHGRRGSDPFSDRHCSSEGGLG